MRMVWCGVSASCSRRAATVRASDSRCRPQDTGQFEKIGRRPRSRPHMRPSCLTALAACCSSPLDPLSGPPAGWQPGSASLQIARHAPAFGGWFLGCLATPARRTPGLLLRLATSEMPASDWCALAQSGARGLPEQLPSSVPPRQLGSRAGSARADPPLGFRRRVDQSAHDDPPGGRRHHRPAPARPPFRRGETGRTPSRPSRPRPLLDPHRTRADAGEHSPHSRSSFLSASALVSA